MKKRNNWSIVFLLFILFLGMYVKFYNDDKKDYIFNVFRGNYDYESDFYLSIDGHLSDTPIEDMERITSNLINVRPKMKIIIESDTTIVYQSPFFKADLNYYYETDKLRFKSVRFYSINKNYCEN